MRVFDGAEFISLEAARRKCDRLREEIAWREARIDFIEDQIKEKARPAPVRLVSAPTTERNWIRDMYLEGF